MAHSIVIATLVVVILVVVEARPRGRGCRSLCSEANEAGPIVCGSDGIEYRNQCHLQKVACFFRKDIEEVPCEKAPQDQGDKEEPQGGNEEEAKDESDSSEESDESDEESPAKPSPVAPTAGPTAGPTAAPEPPVVTMVPSKASPPPQPEPTTEMPPADTTDFITEEFFTDIATMPPVNMDTRAPTSIPPTPCATSCPLIDNMAVCGTDGMTYTSRCVLEAEACMTRDETLQVAYEGPCLVTLAVLEPEPTTTLPDLVIP